MILETQRQVIMKLIGRSRLKAVAYGLSTKKSCQIVQKAFETVITGCSQCRILVRFEISFKNLKCQKVREDTILFKNSYLIRILYLLKTFLLK